MTIDENISLEEAIKRCASLSELSELVNGTAPCGERFSDISVSNSLVRAAKDFVVSHPNFGTADIQREFSVGYPTAAKLFAILRKKRNRKY